MPWIISAFFIGIAFILWGLIMAGTISILTFVGVPYILVLPISAITPIIILFLLLAASDVILSRDPL